MAYAVLVIFMGLLSKEIVKEVPLKEREAKDVRQSLASHQDGLCL